MTDKTTEGHPPTGVAAPLRLLLISGPAEFDPKLTGEEEESDREWMCRQARKLVEFEDGRGVQYLNAAEYTRIKAVWLDGEERPPVTHFSVGTYGEIRRAEERLNRPWAGARREASL